MANQALARLLGGALLRRASQSATQQLLPAVCIAVAAQQGPQQLQHRAFTASGAPSADPLASMLKKEIKHEKSEYVKPEEVARGPPAPFTVTTEPGDTAISLKRDYKGEQISVDCSVNLQDSVAMAGSMEEEDEEEDDFDSTDVQFNVSVTKGDQALVFECVSDGTYMDIRHVSFEPAEGLESETAYTGPVFQELDDDLQAEFRSFLEARGIDEELGEYLRHMMYDKEQTEYVSWLQRVHEFVTKPAQ